MPIKPNKPFNPCPQGQQPCNNHPGDKSCCPNRNPKNISNEPKQVGPPKARSNLGTATPRFKTPIRAKKNIIRDIVVSGNRPIPKVTYAKDGTKRFHVNEGRPKQLNRNVTQGRRPKVIHKNVIKKPTGGNGGNGGNGGSGNRIEPACCFQPDGNWYCNYSWQVVNECADGADPWDPHHGFFTGNSICSEDDDIGMPGHQLPSGQCQCNANCTYGDDDDGGYEPPDEGPEPPCYGIDDNGNEFMGCYCWTGAYNNDIHTCVQVTNDPNIPYSGPFGDCSPYHPLNAPNGQCPPDPGWCYQGDIDTWNPHGCPPNYTKIGVGGTGGDGWGNSQCRCESATAGQIAKES